MLFHDIRRASQTVDAIVDTALHPLGITGRQYVIMKVVARCDRPSQTDIVTLSGIDRSTVANMIPRMISRDLLSRVKSENDGRTYEIALTSRGNKLLAKADIAIQRAERCIIGRVPGPSLGHFKDSLDAVANARTPSRISAEMPS